MMVWPIRLVATILSNYAQALAAMDRLKLILDEPLEDLKIGIEPKIQGNLLFENVSFQFVDGNEPVLKNVNLKVITGSTVAFLGKTVSGKSTLAHLLIR